MRDATLSRWCNWIPVENIDQYLCGVVPGSFNEDVTNLGLVACSELSYARRTSRSAQDMTHLSGFRNWVQVRSGCGVARSACGKLS